MTPSTIEPVNTKSIPLEFAAIAWTRVKSRHPRIAIVDIRTQEIPDELGASSGAVFAWWTNPKTPTHKRLLELLWIRGEMIADRIPYEEIHEAMGSIPEFTAYINGEESKA